MRRSDLIFCLTTLLVVILGYLIHVTFLTNFIFFKVAVVIGLLSFLRKSPRWQLIPAYAVASLIVMRWIAQIQLTLSMEFFLGTMGIVFVLASVVLAYLTPLFKLPDLAGKYSLGRISILKELPQQEPLNMVLWFPAKSKPAVPFLPYHFNPGKAFKGVMGMPGFVFSHLKLVTTHAQRLPFDGTRGSFPLIVYSHGTMSCNVDNTAMVEELVSQGYLVLGIQHKFSFEQYGLDGKAARQQDAAVQKQLITDLLDKTVPIQAKHHELALKALRADSKVSGFVDWNNCGAIGHSLGGATAVQAKLNGLYKAVVNIDGPMPAKSIQQLDSPFLYLSSYSPDLPDDELKKKRVKPDFYREVKRFELKTVEQVFAHNKPDQTWIRFPKAGHLDFTDLPFMVPMLKTKGYKPVPGHIAKTNVILEFFDQHLKQMPPKPVSTSAHIERLAPSIK